MKITADLLNTPVSSLPMVGPAYARKLTSLGIHTVEDLIHYYPFRYDDLSQLKTAKNIQPGEVVTLNGQILSITNTYIRGGRTLQKAVFTDGTGTLNITWFNQPYLVKHFQQHPYVALSGKVTSYRNKLTLQAPQHETVAGFANTPTQALDTTHTGRLVPIYHETEGVSSKWLRSRLKPLLHQLDETIDWLPVDLREAAGLLPLKTALEKIHYPETQTDIDTARYRLSYDEMLVLQLAAQWRKRQWQAHQVSHRLSVDEAKIADFIRRLPFQLTPGQQTALNDIVRDLAAPTAMNRLLQGDVGAGKTVVAAIGVYISHLNGLPAAFMAPTEVLALQHYQTLKALLEPLGLKLALHTHSETQALPQADLYIGTHALLYRQLPDTLGLVVIDEQHRFGVEQRAHLLSRPVVPNVLSMTATPIPRTIALTLYAELDMSVIGELPHGRLPIKTWLVPETKRQGSYAWIKDQITQKQAQVFVVCPLIQDSVAPLLDQVKAAETQFVLLKEKIFPDLRVGLLHGRLKPKAKKAVVQAFKDRELDILVTTPVIEVGIDIPQASIIVIEAAERFGLAQLHQLRGRVGRGREQSYCLLFTTNSLHSKRLRYLAENYSGMRLAELDLKLRGPGDMFGTQQSGYIDLKIASLADQELISQTYQVAERLIRQDPQLHDYPTLLERLKTLLAKRSVAN